MWAKFDFGIRRKWIPPIVPFQEYNFFVPD